MSDAHRIIPVKGHYEAYDSNGNFIVSGDTWDECEKELIEILVSEANNSLYINNEKRVAVWPIGQKDTKHRMYTTANQ